IDGSSLRTFEVGRAQPRNAGRPRNRETPTRRSQWAAVSSGDSMRNHLVREDRPGAATGETAALLRALGQPLHILKFAFRSGHYHFGLFARPDGGLAAAQERMAAAAVACITGATSVVDIGCGLGGTSMLLARTGADVVAIDPCADAVDYARHTARARGASVRFAACTLQRFAAGAPTHFEAAVAIEVLQHFPALDEFFARCAEVLCPGGRLVVHDVCVDGEFDPAIVPYHARHRAAAAAQERGFTLESYADRTREVE